jgi:hypothetical protein
MWYSKTIISRVWEAEMRDEPREINFNGPHYFSIYQNPKFRRKAFWKRALGRGEFIF